MISNASLGCEFGHFYNLRGEDVRHGCSALASVVNKDVPAASDDILLPDCVGGTANKFVVGQESWLCSQWRCW